MLDLSNLNNYYQQIKDSLIKQNKNDLILKSILATSSVVSVNKKKVKICVINLFAKKTLETRYKHAIESLFLNLTNNSYSITFLTELENKKTRLIKHSSINESEQDELSEWQSSSLKIDLSFDNLIIGEFNKDVIKATSFIDQNNPIINSLLIYGTTGTGKTHILNAITKQYIESNPDKNVLYIDTEDFLTKAYTALANGTAEIEKFKNKFKSLDLLIVDDIQLLANKDRLNEIFFSIFNYLTNNKKCILLSSDKLPQMLSLDERMISRFNSGLVVKINKPDLESIKKIIVQKVNVLNFKQEFTNKAVEYIALNFNSDLRILQGIINKIYFYACSNLDDKSVINADIVKSILEQNNNLEILNKAISLNHEVIIENVCLNFKVDKNVILSKKRDKKYIFPRKICMYLLRKKLNYSLSDIGKIFANRDHSSVLVAIRDIEESISSDQDLMKLVDSF